MSKITKVICDRCEKEIIQTEDEPYPWEIIIKPDPETECRRNLCDDCMFEFHKWLSEIKGEVT